MVKSKIITLALCAMALGVTLAEDPAPIPPPSPIAPIPPPVSAAPSTTPGAAVPATTSTSPAVPLAPEQPAPIEPPASFQQTATSTDQAGAPAATTSGTLGGPEAPVDPNAVAAAPAARAVNEFQGDDINQVLRLLARQAKINLVVSDKVQGTVTIRLVNKSPLEAIDIVAASKNLIFEERKGGVYYVITQDEKAHEPLISGNYTFSYALAPKVKDILDKQLAGGVSQVDDRTNTIFYSTPKSNMDNVKLFLSTIDKPTRQVMIEARLVEVTANPQQSYGINWSGVVGSASAPQTIKYGGSSLASSTIQNGTNPNTGAATTAVVPGSLPTVNVNNGKLSATDFLLAGSNGVNGKILDALGSQFAILSVPQMQATMQFLNEDQDAEFLANPRVVTANNQKATIKIIRNQPVPSLNFNEQTATAVFGGFTDKTFGNTLVVTPSINKDNFITMLVQPEISNKVADATFTFGGATVASPIIDTRTLESNVLIKSGDTLAIGGLLQDEVTKTRNKVPIIGDIPVIGYAFQSRQNARTKRNLLIFVTPTIIVQGYGTGLEDQVSGLYHSGEEYADPNGWRNNAKGAYRLVPTSNRQIMADYPKPGAAPAPEKVNYKVSASNREQ